MEIHGDEKASSYVNNGDDLVLVDSTFGRDTSMKNGKVKNLDKNSNLSSKNTRLRKGPYESDPYDDDDEARRTWQFGKSLGLNADNDEDMVDALAIDHMQKEEGTKNARARGKKGRQRKGRS